MLIPVSNCIMTYFLFSAIKIGELVIFSNKVIGHTDIGTVLKGEWRKEPCAAMMFTLYGNSEYTEIHISQQGEIQKKALLKFKQECSFMKALSHPNIMTYYDTLEYKNLPVLVMEFVDISLNQYLTNAERLSEMLKLKLLHNIVVALTYLHDKNIIHRALYVHNIFLRYSENDIPVAKITGFGMSRSTSNMSHSLTVIERACVPPEASAYPASYDSSFDIFMFGAVMAQIAKRHPILNSKNELIKLVRSLKDDKHPLSLVIDMCLKERKENRPTTSELCASLQELLATG